MNLFHYTEIKKKYLQKKVSTAEYKLTFPSRLQLCTSVTNAVLLTNISCTHKQFLCLFSFYESVVKHSSHVCVTLSLKCGLSLNRIKK